ncbi:MAG TPA: lytic transglycosylase domain-containing protein [Arenibaculum sp.]|nr:lytic transglycosylase domain-containing protein [Arenibaculum sp.]
MTIDSAKPQPPLPGRKPMAAAVPVPPAPGRKPAIPVQQAGLATAPLPGRKPEAPEAPPSDAERLGEAIRSVAGLSGHSFSTLLAQATQESGLDLKAKSRTSSAAGPFQFIERTWLDMIRRHGAAYGIGDLARAVLVRDGAPTVRDPDLRRRILDLREDPHLSAGMAARYLAEGREALSRKLKRPVSEIESRIAYVMGVGGAAKLLNAAKRTPDTPARDLLPHAARANRPLFHDETGRVLGAGEMVARLTRRMEADELRLGSLPDAAPHRHDGLPGVPAALLFAQEAGGAETAPAPSGSDPGGQTGDRA